jgi:hypothetical protein
MLRRKNMDPNEKHKNIENNERKADFLQSAEALQAKYEVEHGQTVDVGSLEDYKEWSDKL